MRYQNKKVILVGGSGFIGTQIAYALLKEGAQVVIVDPIPTRIEEVIYIQSDFSTLPNFDALKNPFVVINLAGVSIFGRWTKGYKNKIRESRINTTRMLVQKFENPEYRPHFFISTSAIGVYGNRRDETLDENSKCVQDSFLAQVAHEWEQEALLAKQLDVEVRIIRNAHVLGRGGILGVMQKIFKLGIGGSLGKGFQYMSFVSIEECVRAYLNAPFTTHQVKNAVSLEPVMNKEFSKILAGLLKVPYLFRIPFFGMYLVYGEFAKEIITSQRVYTLYEPQKENIEDIIKKYL
jgi:uncharacterized protein